MKKGLLGRIVGISLVSLSAASVAVASLAWFSRPGGQTNDHIGGEVSLRSYYYDGNGTSDHPFEIVSPIHFYNLTRLQNLGLYSGDTWFQIGHKFPGVEGFCCINRYDPVTKEPIPEHFLDMGDFSKETTILPIGGEGAPFYGHFDGKGVPITNLTVTGYPEDIGIFGYVAHGAVVENLVCKNLTVESMGYSATEPNSNKLFSEDIDDIFENASTHLASDTNLHFYTYDSTTSKYAELKDGSNNVITLKAKSATGAPVADLNKPENVVLNSNNSFGVFNGYFDIDFPAESVYSNYQFKYSWRSSSPIIRAEKNLGVNQNNKPANATSVPESPIVIDLNELAKNTQFNSGKQMQIDVRLSLIASVTVDGHVFSRVIQSYTVELFSNRTSYNGWVDRGSITIGESGSPTVTDDDYYFHYAIDPTDEDFWEEAEETAYTTGTAYSDGDVVTYNNAHYKRNGDITAEGNTAFGADEGWEQITTYSSASTYEVGDCVLYGDTPVVYRCIDNPNGSLFIRESSSWSEGTFRYLIGNGAPTRETYAVGNNPNQYKYYIDLDSNSETPKPKIYEYNPGYYSAKIFCDYKQQKNDGTVEGNYHHGNNIGFLAGHVDGIIRSSYVYNGTFKFNGGGDAFVPIGTETETGLVGEIGTNVANDIETSHGYDERGDTGVLNISGIYDRIRSDVTAGSTIYGGKAGTKSYISYEPFLTETSGEFKNYLRYYDKKQNENHFIVNTGLNMEGSDPTKIAWHDRTLTQANIDSNTDLNSVDFLWNKIIEDDDTNRGLGAFKIITSYNSAAKTEDYATHMLDNVGECRIINGQTVYSKVYFSTAEYDYEKEKQMEPLYGTNSFNAYRPTREPSYCDTKSFEYPFSRDYNYVYELDLAHINDTAVGDNYYMYNTTSKFLANYLYTKLIDEFGDPIKPGSEEFGFMFRSYGYTKLANLSSYMKVKKPGTKNDFGADFYIDTLNTELWQKVNQGDKPSGWPSNQPWDSKKRVWKKMTVDTDYCLGTTESYSASSNEGKYLLDTSNNSFVLYVSAQTNSGSWKWKTVSSESVKNGKGDPDANLDIRCYPSNSIAFTVANEKGANVSVVGKGGDITIYKNDTSTNADATPFVKMKASAASGTDEHRYFEYQVQNDENNTGNEAVKSGEMSDGGVLYGHIFKLPAGDYVIGSDSDTEVNLYYLSVQGTINGTIGVKPEMANVGNAITEVDFLTTDPIDEENNELQPLTFACLSFDSTFDSEYENGTFTVTKETGSFCLSFDTDGLVVSLRTYLREGGVSSYKILNDTFNASKDYTEHLSNGGT